MQPFDLEVWYGERVAVLGSNGSGKSHFLRLLAAGGSDPDVEHRPVDSMKIEPVRHTGKAKLGARVRPGWFVQTHAHPELLGRTLLEILHRGDEHRDGMGREAAARVLDRYELAHASEQKFESLSGGQQARFQILLLELSGATLLLLDEPTDNLDVQSAEALEAGLEAFDGTVVAVTHDRWFARGFDRFLVYGADGDGLRVRRPGLGRDPGPPRPLTGTRLARAKENAEQIGRPGGMRGGRSVRRLSVVPRSCSGVGGLSVRVEGGRDRVGRATARVGERDRVAGPVGPDDRDQRVGRRDQVVVDLGDHVAGLEAGAGRRRSRCRPWRPWRRR